MGGKKHLDYENTEKVLPDLIPIYDDLAEIKGIVPVAQAKRYVDNAKKALKRGNKESAKKALRQQTRHLFMLRWIYLFQQLKDISLQPRPCFPRTIYKTQTWN